VVCLWREKVRMPDIFKYAMWRNFMKNNSMEHRIYLFSVIVYFHGFV
jgi:hypothetical protein